MRLATDRNTVELIPDSLRLDYDLVRALSPDATDALPTERLEAITAAFTGPFLADLSLPRCQAFEAWRVYCANETEILRLKVLRTLIGRFVNQPERALSHAHALQSLLPDDDLAGEIARIRGRARVTVAARPVPTGSPIPAAEPRQAEPGTWNQGRDEHVSMLGSSSDQHMRFVRSRDEVNIAYAVTGSGTYWCVRRTGCPISSSIGTARCGVIGLRRFQAALRSFAMTAASTVCLTSLPERLLGSL